MPLFERTIKMVLTTLLAIILAEQLQLSYSISAGIIALLSLQDTRKSSLAIAKSRLLAFFLAFAIAYLAFFLFGFNLWALFIYLLFSVPLLYYWHLEAGLVPITVLVSHLLLLKSLNIPVLFNELWLFLIGTGIALLGNTYMGKQTEAIKNLQLQVERELKELLFAIEDSLLNQFNQDLWEKRDALETILENALKLVYRDSHNQLFSQTNYQVHYFEMRQRQIRILKDILTSCQKLRGGTRQSILLAHLIHETGQQLSEKNSALTLLEDIDLLLETYRQGELPQSRQEFENRAQLFLLLQDLERFISEKTQFYKEYKEES